MLHPVVNLIRSFTLLPDPDGSNEGFLNEFNTPSKRQLWHQLWIRRCTGLNVDDLKSAKQIGLSIPPKVLARADKVIK